MAKQTILIRYGELGLKGKNKHKFISRLVNNIRHCLSGLEGWAVRSTWGRIWVDVDTEQVDAATERLQSVFGIYSLSPVLTVEKEMTSIAQGGLEVLLAALPNGGTFKVETRRSDKTFPGQSPEISLKTAEYIFDRVGEEYQADMHRPEITVNVEIRGEGAFVYGQKIHGAGGLPVGCGGKAMLLLSGGIDSPVAGWMAMKRGVSLEAVHYHSFPFTGEKAKEKVFTLCTRLAKWQGMPVKLHVVHFTEIQKAIYANGADEYGITLMRRMMFRLAECIAEQRNCLALYTGESVGQVASQTLESMAVINDVVNIPVMRPLIGMDKEEIMALAKKIGTFETSILPYEDCCTVFLPKHPKIRPVLTEAVELEKSLDIPALLEEALAKTETVIFPGN